MSTGSRKEILDLLAGGKINVDEAAEMLSQTKETETAAPAAPAPPPPLADPEPIIVEKAPPTAAGNSAGWFRVRVNNLDTGKSKVSVNIPVRMLKFGFTLASHFTPEVAGLDMSEMEQMLNDGESGILVDVRDEDSNEHVQVFFE